jgi:SAM-dependent methyltransferase
MRLDRLAFDVMYRVGFMPWDNHQLPARLRAIVEGDTAPRTGKALDVGCGTGDTSIYLARHGWNVTAVDFVERALRKARTKTAAAGVSVRYVQADVTRLGSYDIGSGFELVVDNGCLHGLSDAGRDAYVRGVSALVGAGGRLVLCGFAEGKRPGPRGFNRPEIERRFAAGWRVLDSGVDPLVSNRANDPIYVYELCRT